MEEKHWVWELANTGCKNNDTYEKLREELIRFPSREIKNVFFVGNGAVENGAKPIIEWVKENNTDSSINQSHFKFLNALGDDLWSKVGWDFALSFIPIFLKCFYEAKCKQATDAEEAFHQALKLRDSLASHFQNENTKIRGPLPDHLKHILNSEDTLVVCTNWDTAFFNARNIKNIIQIHGMCTVPESMVLPTESALDALIGRNTTIQIFMKNMHGEIINILEKCECVYVWGLSMSTYDAELMNLLTTPTLVGNKIRLKVINREIKDACRAAMLMRQYEFDFIDASKEYEEITKNLKEELEKIS